MKHKLTLNKNKYQLGLVNSLPKGGNGDLIGGTIGNLSGVAQGIISKGYKPDYGETGNAISAGVDVGLNVLSAINPVVGGALKLGKGIFDGIKGNQQRKKEEAKQAMIEQGMRENNSIAQARSNANPNAYGNRLTTIYQLGKDNTNVSKKELYLPKNYTKPQAQLKAMPTDRANIMTNQRNDKAFMNGVGELGITAIKAFDPTTLTNAKDTYDVMTNPKATNFEKLAQASYHIPFAGKVMKNLQSARTFLDYGLGKASNYLELNKDKKAIGGWIDYDRQPASKKPYQYQLGGIEMMPQQGGKAIPLNSSGDVLYQGNQHSEGGIQLPNAEVENGEVAVNTPEGTIIKSDILIDPQDPQKRTFAEIAQENAIKKGMYEKKLLKLQDKIQKKEFISSEDNGSIKVIEDAIQNIDTIQQEAAERQEQIKQETLQVDANSPEAQEGLRNGGQRMEFNNVQPGQEFTGEGMDSPTLMQLGTQEDGYVDIKEERVMNPNERMIVPEGINKVIEQKLALGGKLIKRADGSYSKRGLWDNIRANKGSGKKPTKQMLEQEKKIKNMQTGGEMVKGYGKFLRQTKRQELKLAGDRQERKNIRDKYSILNQYRPDKSGMSNEDYANLQTKLGMMTTKDSMSNANQVDMIDNDIIYQLGKPKYQTAGGFSDNMLALKEEGYKLFPNDDIKRQQYYSQQLQSKYPNYQQWNQEANKYAKEYNFPQVGTANNNWNSFQNMSRSFIDAFNKPQPVNAIPTKGIDDKLSLPKTTNNTPVVNRSGVEPLEYKNPTEGFKLNERLYNNKPLESNIGQQLKDKYPKFENVNPDNYKTVEPQNNVAGKTKGNGLLNFAANADIIAGAFNLGRDKKPPYKDTTGYINPALEQYNTTPINETYRSTRRALQNNSAQNQNLQLMNLASKQSKDLMSEIGGVNNRNIDRRNNAQAQNINIEAGNNQTMYENQANQVKFKNDRNAKLQQLASQVSSRAQSMIRDNNANDLANKQLDLYNNYFNGTTTETKPTLESNIATGINNFGRDLKQATTDSINKVKGIVTTGINNRNQNYVNKNIMNNQIPNIQVPQININNPNVGLNNNTDPYAIQGNVNEYGVPNNWLRQKGGKLQKGKLKLGSLC